MSAGTSEFARRVMTVVRRIPRGHVTTYGTVASLAGRAGAARAVGRILREGRDVSLPYHRVIAANGKIGGYGGDVGRKVQLLASEGLMVTRGRVKQFDRHRWPATPTPRVSERRR